MDLLKPKKKDYKEEFFSKMLDSCKGGVAPLLELVLRSRRVYSDSYEVTHKINTFPSGKPYVQTTNSVGGGGRPYTLLPLSDEDAKVIKVNDVLFVDTKSNSGDNEGLFLFCTGKDLTSNGKPIVRCFNGPKNSPEDPFGNIPAIPKGSNIYILGNASHLAQTIKGDELQNLDLSKIYPELIESDKEIVTQNLQIKLFHTYSGKLDVSELRNVNKALYYSIQSKISFLYTQWDGNLQNERQENEEDIAFNAKASRNGILPWIYTSAGLQKQLKNLDVSYTQFSDTNLDDLLQKVTESNKGMGYLFSSLAFKKAVLKVAKEHPEKYEVSSFVNEFGWNVDLIDGLQAQIQVVRDTSLDCWTREATNTQYSKYDNRGALVMRDSLVHYVYDGTEFEVGKLQDDYRTIIADAMVNDSAQNLWIDLYDRD